MYKIGLKGVVLIVLLYVSMLPVIFMLADFVYKRIESLEYN